MAFLGVVPTGRFLAAHRAVVDTVRPLVDGLRPYYAVDALLPHCTLATGVTDAEVILDVVAAHPLPIDATVHQVGLVEVPSGRPRATVS